MKLRTQMLLACALTLLVPIVGWHSAKQLYATLQQTRIDEQSLKVLNLRVAIDESEELDSLFKEGYRPASSSDWYAETSRYPIFVDGYSDDWRNLTHTPLEFMNEGDNSRMRVRFARYEQRLFIYAEIRDDNVIYHKPPLIPFNAGEGEVPDAATRLVNGDAVEILIGPTDGNWQHGLFRAIAPGPLSALNASTSRLANGRERKLGKNLSSWRGVWIKNSQGYQLEIEMPLPPFGTTVGIAAINVDHNGAKRDSWVGSLSPRTMSSWFRRKPTATTLLSAAADTGSLFHTSKAAHERLAAWVTPGIRARLYDRQGRLLADVNELYVDDDELDYIQSDGTGSERLDPRAVDPVASTSILDAILFRLFAWFAAGELPLLADYDPASVPLHLSVEQRSRIDPDAPTSRYVSNENDRVLGSLLAIGSEMPDAYLLYESNEEHASAYAGSQLARLFSLLLFVSLVTGVGLLIFATSLSLRIRRLSHQAQRAVSEDGRVFGLSGSDARDEIGDLSRNLSSLLARSAAYTDYLEALSSRLSHELRTPLSVVKTSIENLDRNQLDLESQTLIDRASGGADQLGAIIRALVESTRLEQTVQRAEMSAVGMQAWVDGSLSRYQQVYPSIRFATVAAIFELDEASLRLPVPAVSIMASPELLQQALDKLIDNAVDFSSDGDIRIVVSLGGTDSEPQLTLAVANRGEAIDPARLTQFFDPMYSERTSDSSTMHLGLGLYIVRMIAEAHGGVPIAQNQSPWVMIGMRLPVPYMRQ